MTVTPQEILGFWRAAGPKKWFAKNDAFDAAIRQEFAATHQAAACGELDAWRSSAEGALALVLLTDQFPRNLFRGSAHAFATDPLARAVARDAVAAGFDRQVPKSLRNFFYLPFQHSEDRTDQARALALAEALERDTGESPKWARLHADIIERFGRFPHRNRVLGRVTTPAEQAFLDDGGFAG
ncbi:MAG TPA: DUF924 family protein [Caulobacteraceae bacterium]|nr:DUF924 family protein [Caulobacteraceae bacterium]